MKEPAASDDKSDFHDEATSAELGNDDTNADTTRVRQQMEGDLAAISTFRVRSVREVIKQLRITFLSWEFWICLIAVIVGVLPRIIEKEAYTPRPIPYQETAAGDILLELDLNNPLVEESISDNVVIFTCIVAPWVFALVLGAITGPHRDAQAITCVMFLAFGATQLLTDVLKAYCGIFRPNFYDVCEFNTTTKECEGDDASKGQLSFPSAYASLSFCGMTYLSLYLLGKVGLERNPDMFSPMRRVWYFSVTAPPMLYAFFVSASRIKDMHHHPADVVGGALIGFACTHWAYGMWYPSVHDRDGAGVPLTTLFEQIKKHT